MSTSSELKKIAIALGGTGKGSSVSELIDEIEDQIASGHGGGSDLPDPSDAADGSLLAANDGEYALIDPLPVVFKIIFTDNGGNNYLCNSTFSEIEDAIEAGLTPLAEVNIGTAVPKMYRTVDIQYDDFSITCYFQRVMEDEGNWKLVTYTLSLSNQDLISFENQEFDLSNESSPGVS